MEGRSLIDGLAGWGPQFGGSAVWASRSPPAQRIEFGSTLVASWVGWSSAQVQYEGPAWRFPPEQPPSYAVWLASGGLPVLPWRGPETGVRHSSAAVLPAVPGSWGSNQAMIKVLPGRRPARAGLDELTGRLARGSDCGYCGRLHGGTTSRDKSR